MYDLDVCVLQGKIIVVTFNLQNVLCSQQAFTLLCMLYTDMCIDDFPPPTLNGYNLLKLVFIVFFLEFLIINFLWLMYYD